MSNFWSNFQMNISIPCVDLFAKLWIIGAWLTWPFKRQPHEMAKHTQTIRQIADELFECVDHFSEVGA